MHITERINKEMELHEAEYMQKCWAIYLGRKEMEELLIWAKEQNLYNCDELEGRTRPQYHGALVYAVNDDTHLNVN